MEVNYLIIQKPDQGTEYKIYICASFTIIENDGIEIRGVRLRGESFDIDYIKKNTDFLLSLIHQNIIIDYYVKNPIIIKV